MATGEATGKMNSVGDTLGAVNNESPVAGCDISISESVVDGMLTLVLSSLLMHRLYSYIIYD